MPQSSTFKVLLAGAGVLSLARAQVSSGSAGTSDDTVVLTETAPNAAITQVLTSIVTETPTITDSPVTIVATETSFASPASRTSTEAEPYPPGSEGDEMELTRIATACFPGTVEHQPDWTAPCTAAQVIREECTWGPGAREMMERISQSESSEGNTGFLSADWEQQPLELQRDCLCSSQYAEMVLGCGACFAAHGISQAFMANFLVTTNATAVREWTEVYCDPDVAPQEDMEESGIHAFGFLPRVGNDAEDSSASSSVFTTASDSLGNASAVSLYFTPSVSSAYSVDMATASSSANQSHTNPWFSYTSLSISDGLIVPTAVAEKTVGGVDKQSGSETGVSTTTAAAGAMQTAIAYSSFGTGALGLAAMALLL
jgi:hypothetical protein